MMRRMTGSGWLLIGLFMQAAPVLAQSELETAPDPRQTVVFTQRHPASATAAMMRRFSWDRLAEEGVLILPQPYDLEEESFTVYVPPASEAGPPCGLLVWISPGDYGGPPTAYLPVLEARRLIWVGANGVGNDRDPTIRMGLSLDALHNMVRQYDIDSARVYVGGYSGGGRMASELAIAYPDLFTGGGYYFMGCNYRDDLLLDNEGHGLPGFWPYADSALVQLGHGRRFALLTGSKDFNKVNTQKVTEAYQKEGKPWAAYIEVPGQPHGLPLAPWFDEGVQALDRPYRLQGKRQEDWEAALSRIHAFLSGEALLGHDVDSVQTALTEAISDAAQAIDSLAADRPLEAVFVHQRLCEALKKESGLSIPAAPAVGWDGKLLDKALKVRREVFQWQVALLEKGYDRQWLKRVRRFRADIDKLLDGVLPEALRLELLALRGDI